MATICPVCENKIAFGGKCKIADGVICHPCASLSPNHNIESIKTIRAYYANNAEREEKFSKTSILKGFIGASSVIIDENNQLLYFGKEDMSRKRYYSFDEIFGYNLKRVGEKTVTKNKGGLGRAVVGGVLFGGVGAVVGAATSKHEAKTAGGIDLLEVILNTCSGKTTVSIANPPHGLVSFLDKCLEETAEISLSSADEILKFKRLLDSGAITRSEYDAKKKQLLDL